MKKIFCALTVLCASLFCIPAISGFSNTYSILSFEGMDDLGVQIEFPEDWMPVESDGCDAHDFAFIHQDLARESKVFVGLIDDEDSLEAELKLGCGQIIEELYHGEELLNPSLSLSPANHWHTFTICKNGIETSVGLFTFALDRFLIGILVENQCSEPCLSDDINTFVEKIQVVELESE